ncbi:hypothetical protein L6R53_10010 [Myxococcota bacterium]|nr:hypothetical protein [Myxococcota bacterium]
MRAPALACAASFLTLALAAGPLACGEKDAGTPASSAAASASAGAATEAGGPPKASGQDSAGPRDLGEGGARRPKSNNPAPTSTGVPAAGLAPIAVVAAEGKAVVMAEGRRATLRMDPAQTFWNGKELLLRFHDGQRVYGPGDATWWQPGEVPASAANIGAVLQASGQLGTWLEVETLQSGQHRVWANISGQRHRLGIVKQAPTASVFLLAPAGTSGGTASPRLGKASGFQFDGAGAAQDALPTEAEAVAEVAPDKAQALAWKTDLALLRGGAVETTWSRMVDLDRDGQAEGLVCVSGGKDDQDCYVVDTVDGAPRYFGLTGFQVKAGGAQPRAFTYKDGTYLMLVAGGEKSALWVARYDGTRFLSEGVR